MAITAYTGPPGSGKSHALVKEVIVPAVMHGRRVVSNIDGLNPDSILAYCLEREDKWHVEIAAKLGPVVLFDGQDAKEPGFWPTEETDKAGRSMFVQPGDLVVFDEWAMYWPTGDKSDAAAQLELFMRWHRHLTGPTGVACDLAIATQSITDLSRKHRPLLTRSYKFKNLGAVGADKSYTFAVFDGMYQRNAFATGTGKYDPAIYPLYKSSSAAGEGNHTELKTDRRGSIWGSWKTWAFIAAMPLALLVAVWTGYRFVHKQQHPVDQLPGTVIGQAGGPGQLPPGAPGSPVGSVAPAAPPTSPWRIIGSVHSDFGTRIILADNSGATRIVQPAGFSFDGERPVSGSVDGRTVIAEDRLPDVSPDGPLGGLMK